MCFPHTNLTAPQSHLEGKGEQYPTGMSVARGHSLALERVLQPQLTQRYLGLIYFLRRDPFSGGDLHSKRELQAGGTGELGEYLRVEVHPLLVRDVSIPAFRSQLPARLCL